MNSNGNMADGQQKSSQKNLLNNLLRNVSSFNREIDKKNSEKLKAPKKMNKLYQSKNDNFKGKELIN